MSATARNDRAGLALPALSDFKSYPTTLFIGRDGRVRRVYSGFSGPATGGHYEALVRTFREAIEELLDETGPGRSHP